MRLIDHVRSVARALTHNPSRTALMLLGIVIGSGTIVFVAGLLRSGDEALIDLTQAVADVDTIVVRADEPSLEQAKQTARPLSERDIDSLQRSAVIGAKKVVGERSLLTEAVMYGHTKAVTLIGGFPDSRTLYKLDVQDGRFLNDEDVAAHARVCVIGEEVWSDLAGGRTFDASQATLLHIEGVTLIVVGVLSHKPSIFDGPQAMGIWDRKVLVPESIFGLVFGGNGKLDRLLVQIPHMKGTPHTELRKGLIGGLLKRLHLGVTNFSFGSKSGFGQQVMLIKNTLRWLMIGAGIVAVLSGGLNIGNIMLIAVGERAKEIGLRRALGASRRSIQFQFLTEALALSLIGGLIGTAMGILCIEAVGLVMARVFTTWSVHIELWAVAMAMMLALSAGALFGVSPARAATLVEPIEALRSE